MRDPFIDMYKAFEVFYNEPVKITSKDGSLNQTIQCCVFSSTTGDTIENDNFDTTRIDLNFICDRKDWKYVQLLKRGDQLERLRPLKHKKYTVQDIIEDDVMGLVIVGWES